MKKLSILFFFLFAASFLAAEEQIITIESIAPSNTGAFVKTSKVTSAVKYANYILNNLFADKQKSSLVRPFERIRERTGIDAFDTESLKKNGIDIERNAGIAFFHKGEKLKENVVVYVPVLDTAAFPVKFSEIIKLYTVDKKRVENFPVVTDYKGQKVYQSRSDIFSTAFGGYFIFSKKKQIIHSIIDVYTDNRDNLSNNSMYNDFRSRSVKGMDISVYFTSAYLKEASDQKSAIKSPQQEDGQRAKKPGDFLESIDYAYFVSGYEAGRVRGGVGAYFNEKDDKVTNALKIIKTGVADTSLFFKSASTITFGSIDMSYIESMCKDPKENDSFCVNYSQSREKTKAETGIDISKDIIPNMTGAFNIIIGTGKGFGGSGSFAGVLPLSKPEKSKEIWTKIKTFWAKKYGAKSSGAIKIGKSDAFWYVDEKKEKTYITYDKKGIYIGTDVELLKSALASQTLKTVKPAPYMAKKLNRDAFFMIWIKKESFLRAMLNMQAQGVKDSQQVINRIGDVYVTGYKNGNLVTADIDAEVTPKK